MSVRELTPAAAGAVSVLELRGRATLAALRRLAPGLRCEPGGMAVCRLALGEGIEDEAVVCLRGEDHAELHVTGSRAWVERVLAELRGPDGEGGPDGDEVGGADVGAASLADRARAQLPDASCELAARVLLDQAEGALERELEALLGLDEDQAESRRSRLLERARLFELLRTPPTVVLAGPVNAGKSTLFNALLGEERAITSEEEGTTRDVLRERIELGPWPAWIVDTAGERPAAEQLEALGQQLAREERAGSALTLWLAPAGAPAGEVPEGAVLVRSRGDLAGAAAADEPRFSALTDPAGARALVARLFQERLGLEPRPRAPGGPLAPGAGVPFEPDVAAWLQAFPRRSRERRAASLEDLLAGRSAR